MTEAGGKLGGEERERDGLHSSETENGVCEGEIKTTGKIWAIASLE